MELTLDEEAKCSLLRSNLTSRIDGGNTSTGGGTTIDVSQLRTVEKKLVRRMGEGIDRLGNIIKEMARTQRKLDTRTGALELKVFG